MRQQSLLRGAIILILIGLIAMFALAQGAFRALGPFTETATVVDSPVTTGPVTTGPASDRMPARVTHVVDGDTIDVLVEGKTTRVRYIGINAPESVRPDYPVEYMGPEASDTNRALVGGKTVYLERDVSDTDQYGRLLRYVYVDGLFVNAELVRLGLADARRYPPDLKHQNLLDDMESEARAARRGIWSDEDY